MLKDSGWALEEALCLPQLLTGMGRPGVQLAEFYCRRKQADGEQHSNQVTAALTCVKRSAVQRRDSLSSVPFLLPRKNKPNKIMRNCLKLRSHAKASLIKTGSISKNVQETELPDLKTVKTTRKYHALPWIRSQLAARNLSNPTASQ